MTRDNDGDNDDNDGENNGHRGVPRPALGFAGRPSLALPLGGLHAVGDGGVRGREPHLLERVKDLTMLCC